MKSSKINVTRKTSESKIGVYIDFSTLDKNYRQLIKTPYAFLSHMIEHAAYRSGITIKTEVELDNFEMAHLVCEDLGIAFGKAVAEYVKDNYTNGVTGFGDAMGMIDEALSRCVMSFESRTYFSMSSSMNIPIMTENFLSEDLKVFLDGFCQGANCTMQIDLIKGENGHHIWEAIFRSFGSCLKNVLFLDDKRKGLTSGVAGKIEFEIEKKD